ncbi:MAG: shikimate dehydrogenase [Dehalococcoidia bacterium]|nr:shikimate dehydrogenase [Dehalococcoidia bacterium]
MKSVGLIGLSLAHSLSPQIHAVAFARHGLDAAYELWDTAPDALEARVRSLRADGCLGANVTVPYKEAVVPFVDSLGETARKTEAINTIVNRGGRLEGHNTDVEGFRRALEETGFEPRGRRAVLLGAGGAARAVGVALAEAGAGEIVLTDVIPGRAQALASRLSALVAATAVEPAGDALSKAVRSCDLLINCTPLGMRHSPVERDVPVDVSLIPPGSLVFDLVYNPAATPLMEAAAARGARAAGGLAMLVYQAAASFKLWTGLEAPEREMLDEGRRALAVSEKGHL